MNLRMKKEERETKIGRIVGSTLGPEPQLLPHEHRRKARIQIQKKYPETYEFRFYEDMCV